MDDSFKVILGLSLLWLLVIAASSVLPHIENNNTFNNVVDEELVTNG